MQPGDGALVHQMHLNAVLEAPLFMGGTVADVDSVDTFDYLIEVMSILVPTEMAGFVAAVGGAPAGMILAIPEPSDTGVARDMHFYSVWVEPWARGHGAGRALVETALEWATANAWDPVEIWVAAENHTARKLYGSCGFMTVDDHRPLMGHPEVAEVRMVRHGVEREGIAL